MLCQSDLAGKAVNWQFERFSPSAEREHICHDGEIPEKYAHKYSIHSNSSTETLSYNLVIHHVDFDDQGEYTCIEKAGIGNPASANLTVVPRPDSTTSG